MPLFGWNLSLLPGSGRRCSEVLLANTAFRILKGLAFLHARKQVGVWAHGLLHGFMGGWVREPCRLS